MKNSAETLKKDIDAFDKLTQEQQHFGISYPVAELIEYANGRLTDAKRAELKKLFKENIALRENYQGVKLIVKEGNINNEEEYNQWFKKNGGYNRS